MSKPLSNLDYLVTYQPNRSGDDRPSSAKETDDRPSSRAVAAADRAIEEAVVALGGPILAALYKAPDGKRTAFELVDALNVRLENLFAVLDVLADRFQWVTVDKTDPKGNYLVTLTQIGREYVQKTGVIRAT